MWAISTFYSDDMRMAALLQRVAQQVADRAEGAIPLKVVAARQCVPSGSMCLHFTDCHT